jgi:hypothetical protein
LTTKRLATQSTRALETARAVLTKGEGVECGSRGQQRGRSTTAPERRQSTAGPGRARPPAGGGRGLSWLTLAQILPAP